MIENNNLDIWFGIKFFFISSLTFFKSIISAIEDFSSKNLPKMISKSLPKGIQKSPKKSTYFFMDFASILSSKMTTKSLPKSSQKQAWNNDKKTTKKWLRRNLSWQRNGKRDARLAFAKTVEGKEGIAQRTEEFPR